MQNIFVEENEMRLIKMIGRFLFERETRWLYMVKLGLFNKWNDEKYIKKKIQVQIGI